MEFSNGEFSTAPQLHRIEPVKGGTFEVNAEAGNGHGRKQIEDIASTSSIDIHTELQQVNDILDSISARLNHEGGEVLRRACDEARFAMNRIVVELHRTQH
jgi:hypothetical protein